MGQRLDNAMGLYLEGIRDGNMAEALEKYTGDRYTQHSTGVADGRDGFIAFFTPFLKRNPERHIEVVRGFEDGRFVFCHVFQSLNGGAQKWVTADLFDTDANGRIIEHWDVIQAYAEETVSGRSMVDGPTEPTHLDDTESNKRLVGEFALEVLVEGRLERAMDYLAPTLHQHTPTVADGLQAFVDHRARMKEEGPTRYVHVHRVIGAGSFVVLLGEVEQVGTRHAVIDLFRLEAGKIVEHWDVQEPIAPRDQWNNSGKF